MSAQEGKDCSNEIKPTDLDCHFIRDGSYTLVPGGQYTLKWAPPSAGYKFKIMMYESDTVSDDSCGYISYDVDSASGETTIDIPDWEVLQGAGACAIDDGLTGG